MPPPTEASEGGRAPSAPSSATSLVGCVGQCWGRPELWQDSGGGREPWGCTWGRGGSRVTVWPQVRSLLSAQPPGKPGREVTEKREGGRGAEGHLSTGALLQAGRGWGPVALSPPPPRGRAMPPGEPEASSRLPRVPVPEPWGSWACPPNVPAQGPCEHQGAPKDCAVAPGRPTGLLQQMAPEGTRRAAPGPRGASGSTSLPGHRPSTRHSGHCQPPLRRGSEGPGGHVAGGGPGGSTRDWASPCGLSLAGGPEPPAHPRLCGGVP